MYLQIQRRWSWDQFKVEDKENEPSKETEGFCSVQEDHMGPQKEGQTAYFKQIKFKGQINFI